MGDWLSLLGNFCLSRCPSSAEKDAKTCQGKGKGFKIRFGVDGPKPSREMDAEAEVCTARHQVLTQSTHFRCSIGYRCGACGLQRKARHTGTGAMHYAAVATRANA